MTSNGLHHFNFEFLDGATIAISSMDSNGAGDDKLYLEVWGLDSGEGTRPGAHWHDNYFKGDHDPDKPCTWLTEDIPLASPKICLALPRLAFWSSNRFAVKNIEVCAAPGNKVLTLAISGIKIVDSGQDKAVTIMGVVLVTKLRELQEFICGHRVTLKNAGFEHVAWSRWSSFVRLWDDTSAIVPKGYGSRVATLRWIGTTRKGNSQFDLVVSENDVHKLIGRSPTTFAPLGAANKASGTKKQAPTMVHKCPLEKPMGLPHIIAAMTSTGPIMNPTFDDTHKVFENKINSRAPYSESSIRLDVPREPLKNILFDGKHLVLTYVSFACPANPNGCVLTLLRPISS